MTSGMRLQEAVGIMEDARGGLYEVLHVCTTTSFRMLKWLLLIIRARIPMHYQTLKHAGIHALSYD